MQKVEKIDCRVEFFAVQKFMVQNEEDGFRNGKASCRKTLQSVEEKFVVMEKEKCLICSKRLYRFLPWGVGFFKATATTDELTQLKIAMNFLWTIGIGRDFEFHYYGDVVLVYGVAQLCLM
ncbi:uncharacterized protein LOC127075537 [Lathyrus oleraceus]|uniref:uncharacterized protein LOC127075537 n=1 Tax=Pisum sativum TaxID=3888 RepID=UPI001FC408B3|nr:uncharacterized protein LOC127075537 [Pisum sativum]